MVWGDSALCIPVSHDRFVIHTPQCTVGHGLFQRVKPTLMIVCQYALWGFRLAEAPDRDAEITWAKTPR